MHIQEAEEVIREPCSHQVVMLTPNRSTEKDERYHHTPDHLRDDLEGMNARLLDIAYKARLGLVHAQEDGCC